MSVFGKIRSTKFDDIQVFNSVDCESVVYIVIVTVSYKNIVHIFVTTLCVPIARFHTLNALLLYECKTGSSDVWQRFKQVILDGARVEFVACGKCLHVISYKKTSGTKGMLVHKCGTETHVSSQPKINSFGKKILPSTARDNLTTELVKYVSVDLRPFSSVNGVGFQSLCQTLVNLGAQYGNFDVKEALSDRKTVARHVPSIVAENKSLVKNKLAKCDYIAITTDGWTDDHRKISYVTVTAHFFDANLNLQSCILNTGAVHEKKTAEVLCNVVKDVIVEFGCEMAKVTVVSDSAANMIAAFRGQCCRLSCYAHSLNLVVNEIISVTESHFQEFLTGCKNLVRHFKHAGLQHKLEKTLKQECPTRWNSTFTMLQSISEQYDSIHDILKQRAELRFLYAVDQNMLKEVLSFLTHFKSASEMVCYDTKPTLHLVAPLQHRLLFTVCAAKEE